MWLTGTNHGLSLAHLTHYVHNENRDVQNVFRRQQNRNYLDLINLAKNLNICIT